MQIILSLVLLIMGRFMETAPSILLLSPLLARDMQALANATPEGRLIQSREIAEVIAYLLSPASSAIVGTVMPCDARFPATRGWIPDNQVL